MARKDAQPGVKEAAAERRVKALELRKAGASYRAIGQALGVSEATAFQDVRKALAALAKQEQAAALDYRQLELERLDALHLKLWKRAMDGDEKATDRVLRISERRSKLLGMDAPTKVDHSGSLTIKDAAAMSLEELEAELKKRGAL